MRRVISPGSAGSHLAVARRSARLHGPDGRVRITDLTTAVRADTSSTAATALLSRPPHVAELSEPVDPRVGLVLRFDDPEIHDRADGRRQRTLRGWSIEDLVGLGGDAVWLTVWWHPDAARAVRHGQEKFVEIVGHEAAHHQLPLLVEPAVDERPVASDSTPDRELAIARHAIGRFADPRFGANTIAVPCPPDEIVAEISTDALRRHFVQVAQLVATPWILSTTGGPAPNSFFEVAEVAAACGAIGTAESTS